MDQYLHLIEENLAAKIIGIEKIFSRRNKVYLLDTVCTAEGMTKYVAKIYKNTGAKEEAAQLYGLAKSGIGVPEVVWSNQNIIVMKHIAGILLADLMEKQRLIMQEEWLRQLVRWLYQLHFIRNKEGKVFCFPDLNLRNFIYTGKEIAGLDFEETVWDRPERDLGGIAAFILNSNPMFTKEKYAAVFRFFSLYNELRKIDLYIVEQYFLKEMEEAAERRGQQRAYLLSKLKELRKTGFLNDFL